MVVYSSLTTYPYLPQICSKIRNGGWTEVDDLGAGPYAYKGNQWVGYDTPAAIRAKVDYVAQKGLGGAMVWDLSTDDFRVRKRKSSMIINHHSFC